MTARTIEERLDELESRAAIAELVAGYCEGVDRKDGDRFLALWHDDAAYLIPGGRGDFYGHDGIRQSLVVIGAAWSRTWHWTTNHTIAFQDADHATGRSDVFALCEKHEGGGTCLVSATYEDVYERRDGRWGFTRRLTNRWFVSPPQDIPLPPPA